MQATSSSSSTLQSSGWNYFDLIINSDPRVAFDIFHTSALCAIEIMEGAPLPARLQSITPASIIAQNINNNNNNSKVTDACFVIPTHQPTLDARLPQPQDIKSVDLYLNSPTHEATQDILGPAVLHVVQKYRPQLGRVQRKRKRGDINNNDEDIEEEEIHEEEEEEEGDKTI